MLKKIIAALAALVLMTVGAYFFYFTESSASAQSDSGQAAQPPGEMLRYVPNDAFGPGEKLSFDINYGFINAGYATMEVVNLVEYKERPCYHIVSTANSNKFFSSFYRVEDRVESIVDANGLFSWHFEKHLREGSYRSDRQHDHDPFLHLIYYEDDTVEVAPFIQDALSVLYYIRAQELKVGESVYADNFTDGKLYSLQVNVLRKEQIKVKAGRFDCIVVEPLLQSPGIFKHEGKLTVWLTDDRLKMPVLMKSKVIVGSISAELTGYELGEMVDF